LLIIAAMIVGLAISVASEQVRRDNPLTEPCALERADCRQPQP
jgi:hypothetical protein